jgi:hypothetical protein
VGGLYDFGQAERERENICKFYQIVKLV